MSETETDRDLMHALELIMQLSPAARQEWRVYAEWLLHDGRPETDPLRDNAAWQEVKRRRASETEGAAS